MNRSAFFGRLGFGPDPFGRGRPGPFGCALGRLAVGALARPIPLPRFSLVVSGARGKRPRLTGGAPGPFTGRLAAPRSPTAWWSRRGFAGPRPRSARSAGLLTVLPRRASRGARLGAFLESVPGIAMFAARSPGVAALLEGWFRRALCRLGLLGRVPQFSAGEPLHHDVGVLPPELMKRGQKLLPLARPEGSRLLIDQDGPVRVARRHPSIVAGIDAMWATDPLLKIA